MSVSFKEFDENVTLADQLEANDKGPVVLMNILSVAPEDEEALIAAWSNDAEFMKRQPGYISTQLHKGLAGSSTLMNYAIWENVASFRAAFSNPEFKSRISHYPDSAVAAPYLFKKLAVSGHCIA